MKQRLAAIVRRPEGAEGNWLRLVENGPEYDARKRRSRRRFTRQCDAIALGDHRHQRIPLNIKALNARLAPVLGEAQYDMVMHLGPRAAAACHEVFAGKLGPPHTLRSGERMALTERDNREPLSTVASSDNLQMLAHRRQKRRQAAPREPPEWCRALVLPKSANRPPDAVHETDPGARL